MLVNCHTDLFLKCILYYWNSAQNQIFPNPERGGSWTETSKLLRGFGQIYVETVSLPL